MVAKEGKKYACKQLLRKKESQNHFINLLNELTILKKLKHKNIVRLHDKWRTDSHYYILLEYCNEGDLKKAMRKNGGRISESIVRKITTQIVTAL